MTDYTKLSLADLAAMSLDLQAREDQIRAERKVVNKELAFRDNVEQRLKALKGLSKEELERLLDLSQSISGAGGVPSEEKVEGAASVEKP